MAKAKKEAAGGNANPVAGRSISRGIGEGTALVSTEGISFFGGVDPKTGVVVEKGSPIEGRCIAGRVLVFPRGKGSTVGSYVLLQLKKNGKAPAAIINVEAEPIIAVGAIISGIPMVDHLEGGQYELIRDGAEVRVDADKGVVVILG